MISVTMTRNLIGFEDLLLGVGTVQQVRGPASSDPVTVTKINGQNIPFDADMTIKEKIEAVQALAESLSVVDSEGEFLTGFINSSNLALDLAGRLWRKTIDANEAHIYYGTELILKYNPTAGDVILPEDTDYIAADTALEASLTTYIDDADDILSAAISALEDSLGTVFEFDVGTGANNVVQLDGDSKLPAVDGSQLTNLPDSTPIGRVVWESYTTAPANYAVCNGAELSRTTYATLFALIGTTFGVGDGSTTFNIPELRGEFVRGFDGGRGVDTGRVFGSYQADAFKSHSHTMSGKGFSYTTGPNLQGGFVSGGSNQGTLTSASSGGSETRPRNVALQPMIRIS